MAGWMPHNKLKHVTTTLTNQREVDMEAILAVALSAGSEEWIVQGKVVGFNEVEIM